MGRPRSAYTPAISRVARFLPTSHCPRRVRRMPRSIFPLSSRAGVRCATCWEKPASEKQRLVCGQLCLQEFVWPSMCITLTSDTQRTQMRTNIEIDDELIREALRVSGLKTKRAAVEAGLRALIRLNKRRKILDLAGKVQWEGNLD